VGISSHNSSIAEFSHPLPSPEKRVDDPFDQTIAKILLFRLFRRETFSYCGLLNRQLLEKVGRLASATIQRFSGLSKK
jgi:hypothetical protein